MLTRRAMLQAPAALAARPEMQAAQAEAPHICLISGWNLYNIGDVAITPGFLRLVQKHLPEARVTLFAASYAAELGAWLRPRFPDLDVMPFEFKPGVALSAPFEKTLASASLLVLNSGMTLSYGYYGLEWEKYIPRILAFIKARSLKIPYGIYGHSFDRIDPHADVLYADVLSTAAFVYTRDSASLEMLRQAGVRCPEMAFAPDSTFGFDLRDEERARLFMQRHNLEPGRFLAFIPRLDVNRFRQDGREKDHAAQTREIIVRWVRQAQMPVALVPEVQRQIEPAKTMVYDQLPADVRPMVRFQPEYWMPDEAQAVYAKAALLVSAEMHSPILALAAGTPSIHFYFSQAGLKQNMYRDLGIGEWLFDQDKTGPGPIVDALLAAGRDRKAAREKVESAMAIVRRRQMETMAFLRSSVKR